MSSTGWDSFWKDQQQSFVTIMKMATGYFVKQVEKKYHLRPTDKIFDYGCGPGIVSDSLADKTIQVVGADINKFYIEECQKNHPASLFFHISTDIETNKKILSAQLKDQQFDYIFVLSFVQYLNSESDLEDIIRLLREYMAPHGTMLISDVMDENTSNIRDAFAVLINCIKKGKLGAFVRFMAYLVFSDYRKISKQHKLLYVSEPSIREMAKRNALHCEKVKGLTLHASRSNYALTIQ